MRERLRAPKSGVGWSDWAGGNKNRSISIEHDKCGVLIGKPAKRRQRYHPIRADYHQTPKAVADSRQSRLATIGSDSIADCQMAAMDLHVDAITVERYDAVSWCYWVEIAVFQMLGYGQRSCHGSLLSFW
jgi:hypothetical protein